MTTQAQKMNVWRSNICRATGVTGGCRFHSRAANAAPGHAIAAAKVARLSRTPALFLLPTMLPSRVLRSCSESGARRTLPSAHRIAMAPAESGFDGYRRGFGRTRRGGWLQKARNLTTERVVAADEGTVTARHPMPSAVS